MGLSKIFGFKQTKEQQKAADQKRLFAAVRRGGEKNLKVISSIILTWPELLNETGHRRTPLIVAIEANRMDTFDYLLQLGADPDKSSSTCQYRPVHAAAKFGHGDMMLALLRRNVRIETGSTYKDELACNFIHGFVKEYGFDYKTTRELAKKHKHIVDMLDNVGEVKNTSAAILPVSAPEQKHETIEEARKSFFRAIQAEDTDALVRIISQYPHAHKWKDGSGVKPAFIALRAKKLTSFIKLIELGGDINQKFDLGNSTTLLQLAVKSGQKDFVSYLLDKGAALDLPQGQVKLQQFARMMGHEEIAVMIENKLAEKAGYQPAKAAEAAKSAEMPTSESVMENRVKKLEADLQSLTAKYNALIKEREEERRPLSVHDLKMIRK